MTVTQITGALDARVLHSGKDAEDRTFRRVVASDLMSDVLLSDSSDFLLVTSLPSEQVARTVHMVGASGVILVGGKIPQPGLIKLAREFDITLFCTPKSTFEVCSGLAKILEA